MIKPEELRINNLVEYDGKIFKVKTISDYIISADRGKGLVDFTYKEINVIELTEEWLLKFGLKNTETGWEYIYGHYKRISVILYKKFASVGVSGPFGLIHVQIKYVHQFQNLTFALCGSELTIKKQL